MSEQSLNIEISVPGHPDNPISARLTGPYNSAKAFALFVHAFDCVDENSAASIITSELSKAGISTLCINFTNLIFRERDDDTTQLSEQIRYLISGSDFLTMNYKTPILLIGHSLAGISVLAASQHMPDVVAIVTLGAPADPSNIAHLFSEASGGAGKSEKMRLIIELAQKVSLSNQLAHLKKPYMIIHSAGDDIVALENASKLFGAASPPKSLVLLDPSDHMVTSRSDALFVGQMILAWVSRFFSFESQ